MSLVLEQITKWFDGYPAINDLSCTVAERELVVLLGPNGCGKSTLLRLIAGFSKVDRGSITLGGQIITHRAAQARAIGYVGPDYGLFSQMTVAENVAVGLRLRKVHPAAQRQHCDALLELVGLGGWGSRLPRQLLPSQAVRAALARALAHEPALLLLDEPLALLDGPASADLQRTLQTLHHELAITTILATHDQAAAFALANRIGVMNLGRLLEFDTPEQLYHRPQTEFVATFLGSANLLLGRVADGGVHVGPYYFDLDEQPRLHHLDDARRVQVLFRPEDVVVVSSPKELHCPPLGRGELESVTFGGAFERLRIRLPPIPGVRPLSPVIDYGGRSFVVEATRGQDQIQRLPLVSGDQVWVGLHHVHVLTHPGLRFLVLNDGSPEAQSAIALAGQMAQLAHARIILLSYGAHGIAQQAQAQRILGEIGGLQPYVLHTTIHAIEEVLSEELSRQPCDLVVLGQRAGHHLPLAEKIMQCGDHHLLLVPQHPKVPKRALICVAQGEPGKQDVLFAGRLMRHLGTQATIFTALPSIGQGQATLQKTQAFLESGVGALELLGVPADTAIHVGSVVDGVTKQWQTRAYDLLVLGTPLPDASGKISFSGLFNQLARQATQYPVLIVHASAQVNTPTIQYSQASRLLTGQPVAPQRSLPAPLPSLTLYPGQRTSE